MVKLKSSSVGRTDLLQSIARVIMQWQDATQEFDESVGNKLGLIAAERRCLGALTDGEKPAGVLAQASGLTPAAATAMIDRLEKRGFVERRRDSDDRRKVFVSMTSPARDMLWRFYGPIAEDGEVFFHDFSDAELAVIDRFVGGALSIQQKHIDRIRDDTGQS